MEKLTLSDIATVLVKKNKLSAKEAEAFVSAIFDVIRQGLETDQQVKVRGLGTFKIIGVEARSSVNVNTGERVLIDGHSKITFTPDNTMKELVNKPFSQFETVILNEGVEFEDLSSSADDQSDDDRLPDSVDEEAHPSLSVESDAVSSLPADTPESTDQPSQKPSPLSVSAPQRSLLERAGILESSESVGPVGPSEEDATPIEEPYDDVADTVVEVLSELTLTEATSGLALAEVISEKVSETASEAANTVVEIQADPAENIAVEEVGEQQREEETEECEDVQSGSQAWKWLLFSVLSLVLIVLAALGGYYYGVQETTSYYIQRDANQSAGTLVDQKQQSVKPAVFLASSVSDSSAKVVSSSDTPSTPVAPATPSDSTIAHKSVSSTPATAEIDYAAKDVRVRTGAYRIVGFDHEETVRAGETLSRLSRRTLGEGMECYIEVYNDITASTPLREGQKIKIPKLQWKKKR